MKKFFLLFFKELKDIYRLKSTFFLLLILCFIIGYSFYSAVNIYSKASISAVNNPIYATGFEPIQGIFSPTFGALFIIFSFFLPFIIIPLIIKEKEQHTVTILLQIPFTPTEIIIAKTFASIILLLSIFFILLPIVFIWLAYGGHIPLKELLLINLGYLLYGLFVISVSLFSASVFNTSGSASIFSILIISISWLIDFGKDMNISPFILNLSNWTTTTILKQFENGIFSSTAILYFVILSLFFLILAKVFFDIKIDLKTLLYGILILFLGIIIMNKINFNIDITESHRNSFPSKINKALKQISTFEIEIYLRRTDSRYKDYEYSFLKKLLLVRKDIKIKFITGKELEKNYGKFVYKINGKIGITYSNSEEEIFPLIFKLAGIKYNKHITSNNFSGYPLVIKKSNQKLIILIYCFILPLLIILTLVYYRRKR